jgi:hypothetical protein
MPPQEAGLDPTSRSVVARLRVISMAVWVMCTVAGGVLGSGFAIAESGAVSGAAISFWHKAALIGIITGTGALGCFIGYFAKVFIDWACRVLVVLDQLSKK